ncbi:MAG: exodeoxyribonuclease V subunit gamma, partial [Pseudomonas sp.]
QQGDPLSREQAVWRIYGLLPDMVAQEAFLPLRHYLRDDDTGIKRWEVSRRIADVFDRYQYYRPQWIRTWSGGQTNTRDESIPAWQPLLWRELSRDCGTLHRVAMIDALLQQLRDGELSPGLLPQRISGFALSSLPPLFVQVLGELARHTEIHLFQHSPTDRYWADLRSARAMERLRLERPREIDYYDTGNDLLTSWGRQGQAFQDLLLSNDALESIEHESYAEAGKDTLLHRIQQDMFDLHDDGDEVEPDDSVRVMICHSALRECQVLHDQILHWMSADSTLKPEDILVMVPEISRYAPFVESVFRADDSDSRPFIPWNLSDIAVADEHPLVRMFLELLALPSWRFTFSQISAILDVPEVMDNFGMDQQMKEEVVRLLHDSAVRWGLDATHRSALQLPAIEQNTWRHGIDRLLAGYALGEVEIWNGISPLPGASGTRGIALGRFCQLLQRLDWWRQQLEGTHPASQWQRMLNAMLSELFGNSRDEDDKLQQIRDVIGELSKQTGDETISLPLLRRWLTDNLGTRTVSNRFFSGGVTFCGMW